MAHREELPGLGQCSSGPDWDKQPENEWLAACTSAPEPEPSNVQIATGNGQALQHTMSWAISVFQVHLG